MGVGQRLVGEQQRDGSRGAGALGSDLAELERLECFGEVAVVPGDAAEVVEDVRTAAALNGSCGSRSSRAARTSRYRSAVRSSHDRSKQALTLAGSRTRQIVHPRKRQRVTCNRRRVVERYATSRLAEGMTMSAPEDVRRQLSARFHHDMIDGYHLLNREIGYPANRFLQMVNDPQIGGEGAAHLLLRGPQTSYGFATLWEHGRLHQSVEAWVLRPEYEPLFSDVERATARDRLERHRFDVDAYVRSLAP